MDVHVYMHIEANVDAFMRIFVSLPKSNPTQVTLVLAAPVRSSIEFESAGKFLYHELHSCRNMTFRSERPLPKVYAAQHGISGASAFDALTQGCRFLDCRVIECCIKGNGIACVLYDSVVLISNGTKKLVWNKRSILFCPE